MKMIFFFKYDEVLCRNENNLQLLVFKLFQSLFSCCYKTSRFFHSNSMMTQGVPFPLSPTSDNNCNISW